MNKFVLEFEAAELDYLGKVLAERPYREVAPLLAKIDQQLRTRQQMEEEISQKPKFRGTTKVTESGPS